MRAFVGIPLDPGHVTALESAGAVVRASDSRWRGARWVPAGNLHVTLKFLGDIPGESVNGLTRDLKNAVGGSEAGSLAFDAIEAVRDARRARMLWARFADLDDHVQRLANAVEQVSTAYGVEPDTRDFVAHATLVRAKRPGPVDPEALDAARAECRSVLGKDRVMSVVQARLYKSTLTRAGAVYETIADLPVGGTR
jgi:2'-5' RNA ligase